MKRLRKDVEQVLLKMHKKNGNLRPEDVVVAAQDPSSPLHDQFEWDDRKAAHEYRLVAARDLLARARVTVETNDVSISVKAYVHNPDANYSEYRMTSKVKESRSQVVDTLTADLVGCRATIENCRNLAAYYGVDPEQLDDAMSSIDGFFELLRVFKSNQLSRRSGKRTKDRPSIRAGQ